MTDPVAIRRQARQMTVAALEYSIADAKGALECANDLIRAGYRAFPEKYEAQIAIYSQELAKKMPKMPRATTPTGEIEPRVAAGW